MRTLAACLCLLLIPIQAMAQDDEVPMAPGTFSGVATEALGDVLTQTDVSFDTGVLAIEHDGSGNLLYTSTSSDNVGTMDTDGNLIGVLFTASQGPSTNPLGVTTDGSNFYVTDSDDDEVEIYSAAGAPLGTFSVAAETPFPEGVTFSPVSGNLFVVDGAFNSDPPDSLIEYTPGGGLVNQTTLTTLSNDGAAYDPNRCSIWVYESGGDSVTQFAEEDLSILSTFPGTAAAGAGGGEGVAVIGDVLYIMAPGSDTLVSFDIADAPSVCPNPTLEIPTLSRVGSAALLLLLAALGSWILIRRRS